MFSWRLFAQFLNNQAQGAVPTQQPLGVKRIVNTKAAVIHHQIQIKPRHLDIAGNQRLSRRIRAGEIHRFVQRPTGHPAGRIGLPRQSAGRDVFPRHQRVAGKQRIRLRGSPLIEREDDRRDLVGKGISQAALRPLSVVTIQADVVAHFERMAVG